LILQKNLTRVARILEKYQKCTV